MPYEEIVGREGCRLWGRNENKYLDFSAQWVNTNIGHQHPKVIEAFNEEELNFGPDALDECPELADSEI